ncbi:MULTISPECIES: shikimate kinase [unclassified Corynebacterium]|uniref:shikimate kinase n=1 Tax=unclassified Corynebacterium TaxID=2624378 RepID=UPI0030AE24C4
MATPLVVLIGPPGSGKSTIGRRLARAMNVPLTDTDHMIEARENGTCGDVFTRLGEPEFRRVEEDVVAEALTHEGIISLGGGAVLSAATRERLANHPVVYLEVSAEEGIRRTANENTRPVLAAEDPAAHYRALLEYRTPFYEEAASFKVRSDQRSPQRVVSEILSYLDVEEDEA